MIYQVVLNAFVDTEEAAEELVKDIEHFFPKMKVVNPGAGHQEVSHLDLNHCYHDENPVRSCDHKYHWDNCPPPSD